VGTFAQVRQFVRAVRSANDLKAVTQVLGDATRAFDFDHFALSQRGINRTRHNFLHFAGESGFAGGVTMSEMLSTGSTRGGRNIHSAILALGAFPPRSTRPFGERLRSTPRARNKTGRAMNPYDMTVANTLSRMAAWVRGVSKIYRKPLFVMAAATAVLVVGVSAGPASAPRPYISVYATR
jgi:hypothetical protein